MWIPLRVHSQYSVLDATPSVKQLAEKAVEFQMPALALTDHGNLFGAVDFYKACKKVEVKPIIGCEFYIAPGSRTEKKRIPGTPTSYHIVLLAKNQTGYHNLCKLTSIGYLEGFYYNPRIDKEVLERYSEGLICLSSSIDGELGHAILNEGDADAVLKWYHKLFGQDYYLELQNHEMSDEQMQADHMEKEAWLIHQYQDYIDKQKKVNDALIDFSHKYHVKLVATNNSHYIDRDDWRAHEILLNVQSGEPCEIVETDSFGNPIFRKPNPKRNTYPSHSFHFKSPDEMKAKFSHCPEAISNTLEIAEKCQFEFDFKTKHYPVYTPKHLEGKKVSDQERKKAAEEFLKKLCQEGIKKRYTEDKLNKVKELYPDKEPLDVVYERLEKELNVIIPKGMCDYLLIVWDFINWAKENKIPVGPGRGSGAGSIILYLIGVTDIEPLRFNLFFERFINPERISYPDIDVDICMERREEVIDYTVKKYGKENVAQIITFGTMKAKMTIRDVGRVLNVPIAKVNAIAKLVPDELNISLDAALEKDPQFYEMYESDEDAKRIIDIGRKIEGSIRNTGIHAAGIIVCGDPLTDHIPICRSKDSEIPATQFSMKPSEEVGMLKIDFLGLKTLTSIQMCCDVIEKDLNKKIDWVNLPLDDQKTFKLLNQGKTQGVFQLESSGMQDLARNLHLDRFEEIIAVLSLYRPGPMDMIPSFINRKHGKENIENDHPWMEDILSETYGIMVYQEQVMQIASKLANFSLGEGDVLRRAMGKKDMEQMVKMRQKFVNGAKENNIDEQLATAIFDKMEKFAAYGFNKSHAAAYGYLTYVTAYLKANYPGQWMAALLTCDQHDITKLEKLIREAKAMGLEILPPDINEAREYFVATPSGIRFAMTGIKGVGQAVVEAIVKEREENGKFTSFYEFFQRMDSKKVGKKVIEILVDAGSFDFLGWSRDALKISVEPMYDAAAKEQKDKKAGVMSLFNLIDEQEETPFTTPPKVLSPRSKMEILSKEKELLGFFLTGHPLDDYQKYLSKLSCQPLINIEQMDDGTVFRAAVIVESVRVRVSMRSHRKFAILTISDGGKSYELPVWPELFEEKGHLLESNVCLYMVIQVDFREGERRLTCQWFDRLDQVNEEMVKACDEAFDRAKQRYKFRKQHFGKGNKKQEQKNEKELKKMLSIIVDVNKASLSKILLIRDIIEKYPGKTPLTLQFHDDSRQIAVLHLGKKSVSLSDDLKKELKKVPGVVNICN